MIKRLFDIGFAMLWLLLLLPLLLMIAVVIRLTMGGPVVFRQERAGRGGESFEILKFRTMRTLRAGEDELATDHARLTSVGRFLRRTSLDELPELLNVVAGSMSMVGPRPLLCDYLPLYDERQARRHDVRPGLTGLAQVNGRNALAWEKKFELDVWYIDHRTFWLDLRILARTVGSVVKGVGLSAAGTPTAHRFLGSTTATVSDVSSGGRVEGEREVLSLHRGR